MFEKTKKIVTALLLVVVTVLCVGVLPAHTAQAFSFSLTKNFGGTLEDTDYETCSCGFIIFTVYDVTTKQTYKIIWPYVLQLLEKIGFDFGKFPVPRVYDYNTVFYAYQQNVVGNFFPQSGASCWVISNTGCSIQSGVADGWLIGIGSSILRGI